MRMQARIISGLSFWQSKELLPPLAWSFKMSIPSFARRSVLALSTALIATAVAPSVWANSSAASWPSKPVRIVVGFPGGSSPDLTARTFSEPLSKLLGQPVIVENKVGAGGNIGATEVARANDDHTIGLMINGNMTIAKILNPATTYDPLTDLAPMTLIGVSPLVLTAPVAQAGVPKEASAAEFFAAAQKAGNVWSYGTPGIGTIGHLGTELLKSRSGIAPVHIPYSGYPQVATAMLGGQLQMALLPPALALSQAQAGKLRLIGVTSNDRSALAPGVPSLAETGVKDFDLQIWNAFAAPQSMSEDIRNKLTGMLIEIARTPEVQEKLLQQGWQAVGSTSAELAQRVKKDTTELSQLIKEQNISNQ